MSNPKLVKKNSELYKKQRKSGKRRTSTQSRQPTSQHKQRRDLWEVVRKYESQPFVKIAAHKEIHALTKSILQLYETLPLILSNSNNTNKLSDIIYEDTTSLYPEVSV